MNARIKKRIHKIIDLSIDAKDFGHDVFITTYPHVNTFRVDCYKDGWVENAESILHKEVYLVVEHLDELDETIEFLEKLIEESA